MICAFTGHRPEKLPWGRMEEDPRCTALKVRLWEQINGMIASGADTFFCGMARGCDFYFAEAVAAQRLQNPGIRLVAWLPCPEQASRWSQADQYRYDALLAGCDRIITTASCYAPGCMLRRNRAMVDAADVLLSVWDGGSGGTASTVAYARWRGKPVIALWR